MNHTVITALTAEGTLPGLIVEGGVTSRTFEVYVEHCLAPAVRPGQIVAMDNLRAHHSPRVRELIEARGAELRYLPSYSPDLNPIEAAFSKLKGLLRRAAARMEEALYAAIWTSLQAITPQDVSARFRHCGCLQRINYHEHRSGPQSAQHYCKSLQSIASVKSVCLCGLVHRRDLEGAQLRLIATDATRCLLNVVAAPRT